MHFVKVPTRVAVVIQNLIVQAVNYYSAFTVIEETTILW